MFAQVQAITNLAILIMVHVYLSIYIYTYIYICTYVCVYVCTYTYTYTYPYLDDIYIYMNHEYVCTHRTKDF